MHIQLTKEERSEIAILQGRGYSVREIARVLERSPNTVSLELRRNAIKGSYDPQKAHLKARVRKKRSKYEGMKVVMRSELRSYVETHLKKGWSPEQISGRIRCIDIHLPYVSAKSIYTFVYSSYGGPYERCLRRKRKKPRGRYTTAKKETWKEHRVFIDERPVIVEKQGRIGDWEGDFVVSGTGGSGSLLVAYERKAMFVRIAKMRSRKTDLVHEAARNLLAPYPLHTLTLDNDVSFQKHGEMAEILECLIFFCHPYHSWEKGGVESVNGLIREYVPKRSDISKYSASFLKEVERTLNSRPRKRLGYQTPQEVMDACREKTRMRTGNIRKGSKQKNTVGVS